MHTKHTSLEVEAGSHCSMVSCERVRLPLLSCEFFLLCSLDSLTLLSVIVFQTLYTSLFGWHASFLYLRTGSLLPPILSHIFCNVMGFPQLGESLHDFPARKWGRDCFIHRAWGVELEWSLMTPLIITVLLGTYALGVVAYSQTLWPLTQPSLFGGSLLW